MKNKLFICLILFTTLTAFSQEKVGPETILGIYGSPTPFWEEGYRLDSLGVNAVFVRGSSINRGLIEQARAEGQRIYVEFPTLNGKGYVEKHPEAWAINEKGKKVEAAGWFMGVCPTEPGFRRYREEQLRSLLKQYEVDGIWLDYVHWHAQFEEPEPLLPETCFCDNCLQNFEEAVSVQLPMGTREEKAKWILNKQENKWRDWRCEVIADWVRGMKQILHEERAEAWLGLYHCPWEDEAFNGARRRILGLDYELLVQEVDVFSPMIYHERMGKGAKWVGENIQWFYDKLSMETNKDILIWPIVQAYQVPAEEFRQVLENGLLHGSSGVMMFTGDAVARDKQKIQVMIETYRQAKTKQD